MSKSIVKKHKSPSTPEARAIKAAHVQECIERQQQLRADFLARDAARQQRSELGRLRISD